MSLKGEYMPRNQTIKYINYLMGLCERLKRENKPYAAHLAELLDLINEV